MDDAELNRAVAEARNQRLDPPCARYHETDAAEYDSEIGWGGWCYTCGKSISEVAPEPTRVCTDPAAWGGLLEELAAQNTTPSLHRGPSLAHNTVEWFATVYNTYGTPQHAHDPKPGRALALAFLASKGVKL